VEAFNLVLTKFTDETIAIASLIMLLLLAIIIVYWVYNRRKFRQLTHQIPASVVKNYLDSIIQNSTSLKSSLFRGGGLDMGTGIPSVVPVSELPTSSISTQGPSSEELNQKNAEIATLKAKLSEKDTIITELEKRLKEATLNSGADSSEEVAIMQEELGKAQAAIHERDDEITDLKSQIENAASDSGSGDDVVNLTKERDDLKERLMEYEIIEEDLANLKRLQQENAELKEQLASGGGAPASEPVAASEPATTEPEPAAAEPVPAAKEPEVSAEQAMADELLNAAAGASDDEKTPEEDVPGTTEGSAEQKTADELLSEFEKMLG